MLLDVVACCCAKFETGQTFHPTTPNISFFRDRRSVAQQCWIRLHNSSHIVGAAHAHYECFTKTSGLIRSHDALQVPTLLGVAASVCIPLPTRTQQLPSLLAQQCWELLRPLARSLSPVQTDAALLAYNSQHCWELLRPFARSLIPVQTDATLLANNSQHWCMLHVASVCTPCCMLLDAVACCCAKFETGQTFQPTTPNLSFVPWSPKRSGTMLDLFAQLFQHCWSHACSLRRVYKDLWAVSFPRCSTGPNIVESCCIRLHTTANTHAITPNIVAPAMLRAFVRSLKMQAFLFFRLL